MVIMILCGRWLRILLVFLIVLTLRGYVRCFIELQYNSLSSMMTWTAIIIPEEAGVVIFLGRSNDNVDPDYLPRNTQCTLPLKDQ